MKVYDIIFIHIRTFCSLVRLAYFDQPMPTKQCQILIINPAIFVNVTDRINRESFFNRIGLTIPEKNSKKEKRNELMFLVCFFGGRKQGERCD